MNDVEKEISRRIRTIRLQNKLTLKDLAGRTGFTKGYLSMIESGRKSPPIATLCKIARSLGVDIAAFFEKKNPEDRIVFIRKDQGKEVTRSDASFGYRYVALAPTGKHKIMEPFIVTQLPKKKGGWFEHEGEEFIYMLQGRLQFIYGETVYELKKGDCIYFDSGVPHRTVGLGKTVMKALVIISQPRNSL